MRFWATLHPFKKLLIEHPCLQPLLRNAPHLDPDGSGPQWFDILDLLVGAPATMTDLLTKTFSCTCTTVANQLLVSFVQLEYRFQL